MPDISLCADTSCTARGACLRYRARPAQFQAYSDFATARANNGGVCDWRIPVEPSHVAHGYVRPWQEADAEYVRMLNATEINPTKEAAE